MAEKRPLVLFSGGLDSTFRMYQHSDAGRNADYTYVDAGQSAEKVKIEQASVERVLQWLHKRKPDAYHQCHRYPNSKVNFANGVDVGWSQPIPWLICALEIVDPSRHSAVEISYVMGDEIGSRIPALKEAWAALWPIAKKSEFVPLEFPLMDVSKQNILYNMPPDLYDLTWVCELPRSHIFEAPTCCIAMERSHNSRCRACETRMTELYRFELRHGKTLAQHHVELRKVEADEAERAERRKKHEAEMAVSDQRNREELIAEDMADGYQSALPQATFDRLPNRGDWKEPQVLAMTNAEGEPGGFYVTDATTMDQLMRYAHSGDFEMVDACHEIADAIVSEKSAVA